MFLHLSFLKHTMAFLGIAFNNGGVEGVGISLFENIRWRSLGYGLTTVVTQVSAFLFFKPDVGVLGGSVYKRHIRIVWRVIC